ncbi:hypothetical protein Q4512_11215 [Oceanihabitans sp. 2_MG-2023]|uniref:glycosyl-4,4'-diaponeurosporenoate acyltransferase CrtO family protein n=1 Tax=Oceanihabitans sp. 2_MG-2023 TaxID=3062661 RepID=UPI0026E2E42D|nr:hypothetical protein [Oceanihabitans sp. 2_MG-2023]MDO6597486.1 hypothetical protein [Oceanihabitans sp. 2_MG-2023]
MLKLLIATQPDDYSLLANFIIAFLITLFVTGIFAFIGFVFPTHRILPNRYYRLKNVKALTTISNILGVKYFKYLLLIAFWGTKKNKTKYFNGTKKGLTNFVYQTKQSEFGHFAALVILLILSIGLLLQGYLLLVSIITIINIIGNFYPILLQRQHRIRVDRIRNSFKTPI